MRYANDLDRMQETIRAALTCIVNREEFVIGDWLDPNHRCGDVIRMMKEGATEEEIKKKYSGMTTDVLAVYRKIADGTLEKLEPKPLSEKALKKARDEQKRREAAYRRKYDRKR